MDRNDVLKDVDRRESVYESLRFEAVCREMYAKSIFKFFAEVVEVQGLGERDNDIRSDLEVRLK